MHRISSLPAYMLDRYKGWKSTTYEDHSDWLLKLAREGQSPDAMVIACCDSRVNVTEVFGRKPGELFVHRNIANVVPSFADDGGHHGTAAAIEYAVTVLRVSHIVVMGHSQCGGVQGCIAMCKDTAPELSRRESFVGRWLDELRPAYRAVADIAEPDMQQIAMEKECVQLSLKNLMDYPFVREAVDKGMLSLHGLWVEIGAGNMESYDGVLKRFDPV